MALLLKFKKSWSLFVSPNWQLIDTVLYKSNEGVSKEPGEQSRFFEINDCTCAA